MGNESGNSNLKNYIDQLKVEIKNKEELPNVVDAIIKTATEKFCSIEKIEDSYYIKKGNNPLVLLHLNIDSLSKVYFDIFDVDDEESIVSKSNINIITSAILINYLLMYSDESFDVLITKNNIQDKTSDYSLIRRYLRCDNIINLNLRQDDCLADEFSSLILSVIKVPIKRFRPSYGFISYRLSISKLIGGRSGENINKLRLNSIKLIMSILRKMKAKVDLEMVSISAGDRYDNIPSYADIDFIINSDYENELENIFDIIKNEVIEKNLRYEPDMLIECQKIDDKNIDPITTESFNHLASLIELLPSGTFAVNSIDNQTISSSNLATTKSLRHSINIILVLRSLTEESMNQMLEKTILATKISGSKFNEKLLIPRWKNSNHELRDCFKESYNELFDQSLEVVKTQYSLDSSMIFDKVNVNIVSLGVKYKQDDECFHSRINDIEKIIDLIGKVLSNMRKSKENV